MSGGGGWDVGGTNFQLFDAELKFAHNPKLLCLVGVEGGGGTNFQLLMLSLNLL